VIFDVVARSLRRWGYRVFYVQNVTNLDDKLIARAAADHDDPLALADRQFHDYRRSMERLGVRSVDYYPFATDYVPEILEQVRVLVEKQFAYVAEGGSVYFEVGKFARYGALSGQKVDALQPGARVEVDPRKRSPEDFVIWKAATPGEPSWESPWGPGRPGWHVEDTAMTGRLLGERYDLHGGGLDLIFPHHEAEVALSESATGASPMVNYWMHTGLVAMSGEKMSKSLGNISSLEQAIDAFGPAVLRFYYLNAHYRSPVDFQPGKSLEEAREAYGRLSQPADRIAEILGRDGPDRAGDPLPEELASSAEELVERLDTTLADDFNTRESIALLFGWTRTLSELLPNLGNLSGEALTTLAGPYRWAEETLGFFEGKGSARAGAWDTVVPLLLEVRARARTRGDFAEADRIRDELKAVGVRIEDGSGDSRWEFADRS
jgi:cysteinyl-tRNA synthetase